MAKLFHTWTAVWMNVRPVETVLDTGTARAWLGIDMLERVALFLQHKAEEAEHEVYRAFTGVHFVEDCNCCHLTSLVER